MFTKALSNKDPRVAGRSHLITVAYSLLVLHRHLSNAVGPNLTPHLGALLIQINKKSFNRKYSEAIHETLITLDSNGGPEASLLIKTKVPTFLA